MVLKQTGTNRRKSSVLFVNDFSGELIIHLYNYMGQLHTKANELTGVFLGVPQADHAWITPLILLS